MYVKLLHPQSLPLPMHEGGRNEKDLLTTPALERVMDTETLSSFDVTFLNQITVRYPVNHLCTQRNYFTTYTLSHARNGKVMCLNTMLTAYDGPRDIILVHLVVFLLFYRHGN